MFEWICPKCYTQYTYDGILTDRAVGKCSNQVCERYKVSTKIFQHRKKEVKYIDIPESIPNIPKKNTPLITPFLKTAIIMANYALNTIKNKKQVREKDEDSTWYQYYKDWSRIKEIFKMMEENGK